MMHDLSVTRLMAPPPAAVWRAMTEHFAEWWCPKPWRVELIALEWRAGGRSAMEMHGPDGATSGRLEAVVLEVVPERRFAFTDAFTAGWIPQAPFMIGLFELAPEGSGTRYTATARHWDPDARRRHEEMGFHQGWGIVAEQLEAVAARL